MAVDFLVNIRCARAGRGPHALFAEPALSKVEELCYWLYAGLLVWQECIRYGRGMEKVCTPPLNPSQSNMEVCHTGGWGSGIRKVSGRPHLPSLFQPPFIPPQFSFCSVHNRIRNLLRSEPIDIERNMSHAVKR